MTDLALLMLDGVWLWTSLAGLAVGLLTFGFSTAGSSVAPILVMLTVPLQRSVLVGEGGTHLTWTQIAVAAFLAGALLRLLKGHLRITIDCVTVAALALIAVYCTTVVVANDLASWAGETYRWTVALVFLIVTRPYVAQPGAGRNLLIALAVMTGAAFLIGITQALGGFGPRSFDRLGVTRAYGAFGEPNPFGAFAAMATLPCLAVIATRNHRWRTWAVPVAIVASTAGLSAIASTQSRGAAVGLAAGLLMLAALTWFGSSYRVRTLSVVGVAFLSGAAIVGAAVVNPHIGSRDEVTPDNWADRERQAHWGAAAEMIVDYPVLGVGAGGFNDEFRANSTEWRFRISQGHAHNAYLQVAAETGIAGLVAYLALIGVIVWRLLCGIGNLPNQWLIWGALAVTVVVAAHGLFDYVHVLSLGIVLSGIWAFGLAAVPRGVVPRDHYPAL